MSELAQRAVACKGCRWMPGMLVFDDSGARGMIAPLGPRWRDDPDWEPQNEGAIGEGLAVWRPGYGLTGLHGWLPDLTDPATLGCLLALVREAWGDSGIHARMMDDIIWGVYAWGKRRPIAVAATEAEALVKALEASP